uniref:NACHT domain-containing protein n=1 Tax=Neogobius melanostomus TaxID=47308 RepID=A0A8C6U6G4_9GOBI
KCARFRWGLKGYFRIFDIGPHFLVIQSVVDVWRYFFLKFMQFLYLKSLALVGHEYGTVALPSQVEVSEFQMLLQESQRSGASTHELEKIYSRDENNIPPSYCLKSQPVELYYAFSFNNHLIEAEMINPITLYVPQAEFEHPDECRNIFQTAVHLCVLSGQMAPEKAQGYCRSGETSICWCWWDLDTVKSSFLTPEALLSFLCDDFLLGLVIPCNLLVYTTTTECPHGFTTVRRRCYAESLSHQVNSDLEKLMEIRIQDEIRKYVQSEHWRPLLITGGPCTGKTVLIAHCSQQTKSWLPDCEPVVVPFFCSFSLKSSPKRLLSSLCYQIARSYHNHFPPQQDPPTLKQHISTLTSSLPSPKYPLVILISGLDQMDYNCGLQVIESFPSPLPKNLKLLLIASSSRKHIVKAMELHYPCCTMSGSELEVKESGVFCVELGLPNRKQSVKMLASLLSACGRGITSGQQALVNQALTSCSRPLYARLLHKLASNWHSDSEVTESTLPDGVHSSISSLLDHLESKHGFHLVAHAVCYLTLCRTGLTEAELTDLLSNDNKVLALYLKHCDGYLPKLRVPQAEVEKLILDLKPFLCRRTAANSVVLFWVSRHFELVIAKKYLNSSKRSEFHSDMADYYSGRWSCGCAKPLEQDNSETKINIDRQPSSQPFLFTCSSKEVGHENLKKILELPHHLKESGRLEELHKLVLTLDFQQAMVQARLLTDLVAMLETEGFCKEQTLLANVLNSSACFLNDSPTELPSVMELTILPYKSVFPDLEGYANAIQQERKKRNVGVVLHPASSTVHAFKSVRSQAGGKLREAVVTRCGTVVQIMDNGSVWVCENNGKELVKLTLSSEQEEVKFGGLKSSGHFVLLSSLCEKHFLWDVTGTHFLFEIKDSIRTPKALENVFASQEKLCIHWQDEHFVSTFQISSGSMTHFQCQNQVTCVACSSDTLFCGQAEGTVSIFDISTASLLSTCSNPNQKTVVSIFTSDHTQQIGCIDKTGDLSLWDISKEATQIVKETHLDSKLAPKERAFRQGLLSPDGHFLLALLDRSSSVLVWRLATGECILSLGACPPPHTLFKLPSDIICVSSDGSFSSWDSEMIYAAGIARKMSRGVREVVIERDGDGFFSSDGSEAVWKWSLDTGQCCACLLHSDPVEKMCLSPDNINLVTLSSDDIYIWQTESGQNTMRISGSKASGILITPNSNFGVSLSEHGLSRVWKLGSGAIICTIHLYLSDAQISAESTFLIGLHRGELLAAGLWSGAIHKRFCCDEISKVAAFQTLTNHPNFVIVLLASGSLYTWNVAEETVFRHCKIPIHCQLKEFKMSSNGSYALLSTRGAKLTILDLSQFRIRSYTTNGDVVTACLDTSGCYAICCTRQTNDCQCFLHTRPVLTVIRLEDGNSVGSLYLPKNPISVAVSEQHCVVVGFEDGAVGVYYFVIDGEQPMSTTGKSHVITCPFDGAPSTWLSLTAPNVVWS